jgi:hypothetical protein
MKQIWKNGIPGHYLEVIGLLDIRIGIKGIKNRKRERH